MICGLGEISGNCCKTEFVEDQKPPSIPPSLSPGLRPQFRITTLLLLITLAGLLLAAFQYIGAIGTFALILAILVVLAHVAGNAIGTTLRDTAQPTLQPREAQHASEGAEKPFVQTTKLSEKRPLGRPIYIITALSALFWGGAGITVAKILSTKPISLPNSIAGALVLGALGAFWTFVAGSFVQIAFGAVLQALRNPKPPA